MFLPAMSCLGWGSQGGFTLTCVLQVVHVLQYQKLASVTVPFLEH